MHTLLKRFGLSDNESTLYLAALANGPSSISVLASVSGIKRTTLYSCVGSLQERGLMGMAIHKGKRCYKAIPPKGLVEKAQAFENEWRGHKEALVHALPALEKLMHSPRTQPGIEVFEGKNNLWRMEEDFFAHLAVHKMAYQIGDWTNMMQAVGPDQFTKRLTTRRRKMKGTKIFVVTPPFDTMRYPASLYEKDFREIRFLSTLLPASSTIVVCGRMVWIAQLSEPFFGIRIRSGEIADMMVFLWKTLWNTGYVLETQ